MEINDEFLKEMRIDIKALLVASTKHSAQLESLVGNGQPGRVTVLEERVTKIEQDGPQPVRALGAKIEELERWQGRVSRIYWIGLGGAMVIFEGIKLLWAHVMR